MELDSNLIAIAVASGRDEDNGKTLLATREARSSFAEVFSVRHGHRNLTEPLAND